MSSYVGFFLYMYKKHDQTLREVFLIFLVCCVFAFSYYCNFQKLREKGYQFDDVELYVFGLFLALCTTVVSLLFGLIVVSFLHFVHFFMGKLYTEIQESYKEYLLLNNNEVKEAIPVEGDVKF